MRIVGVAGGILLALSGIVWLLQGLNSEMVPQSFMTGNVVWVIIGAVALVAGLVLARLNWTRR